MKGIKYFNLSFCHNHLLTKPNIYILPEQAKFICSSRVSKLKMFKINGERRLFKDNKEVFTVSLEEAASNILSFILQSVDRDKSKTNKNVETVLLGPNSSTFDTSVLLRNSGPGVIEKLRKMDICFGDSLTLLKTLIRKKTVMFAKWMARFQNSTIPHCTASCLPNPRSTRALVDVLVLRRIIFESRLELSLKTIIENSSVVSASHAAKEVKYLDHRHLLTQSFKDNLHYQRYLKKNMVEKISGSRLSFDDLKMV